MTQRFGVEVLVDPIDEAEVALFPVEPRDTFRLLGFADDDALLPLGRDNLLLFLREFSIQLGARAVCGWC